MTLLGYDPRKKMVGGNGLEPIRKELQSSALPLELPSRLCKAFGATGKIRTADTGIFSPLLYRLSYRRTLEKPS